MVARIDRRNPFKRNADAGQLRRHVGKPVPGPIELDDQTLL
ncbi:hypothetical protein [Mesorhizobium waimense]|nr:hypothetical protein [Mesorhizobium waimense]